VQTFVPIASTNFSDIAKVLDNKRLNKQALEGWQIMMNLLQLDPKGDHRVSKGWSNHPAVKMWRKSEHFLYSYVLAMVAEANKRGIKTDKNMENLKNLRNKMKKVWGTSSPEWYHNEIIMRKITTTHRANLFTKDSDFYQSFSYAVDHNDNQPCCDKCKYYWPTHVQPLGLMRVA
jgi:hypothetical protein